MADRVPLQYPLYGATFGEAVGRFWRKYAVFSGRASRSEFWWAYLFLAIIGGGAGIVLSAIFVIVLVAIVAPAAASGSSTSSSVAGPIVGLTVGLYLAIFVVQIPLIIPGIAMTVRRLHDAGYSGLLYLIALVPGAGIVVLVLCILDSNPEGARFDAPPPTEPAPPPTA